jgi:hypothetical protein
MQLVYLSYNSEIERNFMGNVNNWAYLEKKIEHKKIEKIWVFFHAMTLA